MLILLILAFVLFVLTGLGVAATPRVNFLGWGLACLTLAEIIVHFPGPLKG